MRAVLLDICQMTFDKYKAVDSLWDRKAIAYGLNFGILQVKMKTNEVLEKKAIWGFGSGERRSANASAPTNDKCRIMSLLSLNVEEPGNPPGQILV